MPLRIPGRADAAAVIVRVPQSVLGQAAFILGIGLRRIRLVAVPVQRALLIPQLRKRDFQ